VTEEDIVGLWQYPSDLYNNIVTIDLKNDGTFVQTITHFGKGEPQTHTGTWKLEDNNPKLTVLKPDAMDSRKPWVLEDASWLIVEHDGDGTFRIFGAVNDRDPDSCNAMRKIR